MNKMNFKMSVAIPTHEMQNKEHYFRRCMDSLWDQTFQDFEIVVTDNSEDDVIKDLCDNWYKKDVRYYRNPNKGMAPNTNEVIKRSAGDLIKILYMDDFMAHNRALEHIYNAFRFNTEWLVTGCNHVQGFDDKRINPHMPSYTEGIIYGENTIGSPSVLTIKNHFSDQIYFDEGMQWVLDCDFYKRLHDTYGEPTILKEICTTIGWHEGQMTNTMGEARKLQEADYLRAKYV